ncbi:MAG: 2-phospho-L-lactate guanylyltransferase [Myxococcota bacterium]
MKELIFEVTQGTAESGFVAECLTESIVTQAETWEQLRQQVKDAVASFFFDSKYKPSCIRLHLVRDEVFALV